jgi:hypothetical protein
MLAANLTGGQVARPGALGIAWFPLPPSDLPE